jgi:TctA family transporter
MISLIKTRWDMMVLFERPLAVILMLATFAVILLGIRLYRRRGEETAE